MKRGHSEGLKSTSIESQLHFYKIKLSNWYRDLPTVCCTEGKYKPRVWVVLCDFPSYCTYIFHNFAHTCSAVLLGEFH